ncbi:MAG: hypothetical protein EPN20_10280 [Magnetospirillum sp.]|nr:MAG: hypothetical protein EPN20_10280 [Magnetospirillum sp.]
MKTLAALALILALAACAATSVPWKNPELPKDQWSRDYSACRRYADRDVGWRDDDSSSGSPFRDYDRQQAKRRFDAVLASCMIDRGYVPASRNKE